MNKQKLMYMIFIYLFIHSFMNSIFARQVPPTDSHSQPHLLRKGFPGTKRDEILAHAPLQINLKNMINEISQTQKETICYESTSVPITDKCIETESIRV